MLTNSKETKYWKFYTQRKISSSFHAYTKLLSKAYPLNQIGLYLCAILSESLTSLQGKEVQNFRVSPRIPTVAK